MGLRLGSQVIPAVRLYKSGAKYPTGVIEINSETPAQCSVEITSSNSADDGYYGSFIAYNGTRYYTTGDKLTVKSGDVINIWVESQRTDAAYLYLNGEQIAGGASVSGQVAGYNYIVPNNTNVFIRIDDGPTSYVYIIEEELNEKTYDVSDYAFARAEFKDNLYKRIDGDYNFSYYSNSTATNIPSYAFAGTNIINVSLPNVARLYSGAFFSCTSLPSIYLPKLSSMGTSVFANCINLSSFSFPLCSSIATAAFSGCTGLPSNLILPSNFTYIAERAFNYCSNLQTVQCLGAISVLGFINCLNLVSLSLPTCAYLSGCSGNVSLRTVYAPNLISIAGYGLASCAITSVSYPLCSSVGNYAFSGCAFLTSVNLPLLSLVTTGVFVSCSSLETVNIPNCTGVSGYAFSGCRSLTTLSVPLCSFIGNYAFYYCTNFSTLYLASNSVVTLSGINALLYTPMYYSSKYGSIFVPASLVDAYKSATNWVNYSSRITSI